MSDEPTGVAEQFENLRQQHEAVTLGMWIFLASEIMLFGAMFAGYTVYRIFYASTYQDLSHHLNLPLGTINTAILLTSSLTVALAIHAIKEGHRKRTVSYLLATVGMGTVFLGIKLYEWYEEYEKHLVPIAGWRFEYAGANEAAAKLFMSFYFIMTSFHFLHLLIGVGLVGFMALWVWREKISVKNPNPVEVTGLYWHLVDVIWVFIDPLFYLVG